MNRLSIYSVSLLLGLILASSSCERENNYPKDSILGTWLCQEESAVFGFRQYNVTIDYYGNDTTTIKIYNFYNLGLNIETYATIQDTIITLIGTDSPDDFSGFGYIRKGFSSIYWQFNYFGQSYSDQEIQALFQRP
jgi:hypothetical protein